MFLRNFIYFNFFLFFIKSIIYGETIGIELKFNVYGDIIHIYWEIEKKYLPCQLVIFEQGQSYTIEIKEEKGVCFYVASIETENLNIYLKPSISSIEIKKVFEEKISLPDINTKLKYVFEYIDKALTWAKQENSIYNTPISVSIAQSALETGWGRSELCILYNNYFGLKYPWGTGSPYEKIGTTSSNYNIYSNPYDSFLDHGWGLKYYSRYSSCWNYTNDPDRFIKEVRKGGYSEDEMYSEKVIKIMQNYNLYQFDQPLTYSTNFKPNNLIVTTDYLNIREQPAGNLITMLPPNSEGKILENSFNGICKQLDGKNWIWWNVEIKNSEDGKIYTGWCSEHRLRKVKGDINEDGIIDISDVILCLRMVVELDMPKLDLSDINSDGLIDISDLILILRKSIGLL